MSKQVPVEFLDKINKKVNFLNKKLLENKGIIENQKI